MENQPAGRHSAGGHQQFVDRGTGNHGSLVPQAPSVLARSAHAASARDTENKSTRGRDSPSPSAILTDSPMKRVIRSREVGPVDWDSLMTSARGPPEPFSQEVSRPLSSDPEAVKDTDVVMEDRLAVATTSFRQVASRDSSELESRLQSGNLHTAMLEADVQRTGTAEGLMYEQDKEGGGHGLAGTFRKRPEVCVPSDSEDERRCSESSSQGSDEGIHKKKIREGPSVSSPSTAIAWQPLPLSSPKTPPGVMKMSLVAPWAPRKPRGPTFQGPASASSRTSTKTRRQLSFSDL